MVDPTPPGTPGTATAPANVVDRLLTTGKLAREDSQKTRALELLDGFIAQIVDKSISVTDDVVTSVADRIAKIDELVSRQLNEILHAEPMQQLESSWRGLHYLVKNTETGERLKLRVLYASKKELLEDFQKASEFDQSTLFKTVYEEEYGTFGGDPYGVLIGDYQFGRAPQDIALLELISNVAAAAHAPFIAAVSPKMFDMDEFTTLPAPRDLAKIFESAELVKWRSFRESEDSRYVTLVQPRVLLRLPYGPDTVPVEGFNFVEDVDGRSHQKYLWGNAAYALGQRITDAFAKYSWCAAIRGVEGGGAVENLPVHTFRTDEGDIAMKCPTEVAITDRREKELSDLGFLPLVHRKGADLAAFFGSQTANKPKYYDTPEANANARVSSQLPYIIAASRFAHYMKVMMRDKVGSFMSREEVSGYLNRWISQYVLLQDVGSQDLKARFPLREARVDVTAIPEKPGSYRAIVFLKPHFQLNELTASIRLVAELPAPVQTTA